MIFSTQDMSIKRNMDVLRTLPPRKRMALMYPYPGNANVPGDGAASNPLTEVITCLPLDLSPCTTAPMDLTTSLDLVTTPTANDTIQSEEMTPQEIDPTIAEAAIAAVATGSIMPLLKQEIKCSIQRKRLLDGKDEIMVEYRENEKRPLSCEEESRRERRRERNKMAAQKCRSKRKERADQLEEESDQLAEDNELLQDQIRELEQEKERLRFMLRSHDIQSQAGCGVRLSTDSSDSDHNEETDTDLETTFDLVAYNDVPDDIQLEIVI